MNKEEFVKTLKRIKSKIDDNYTKDIHSADIYSVGFNDGLIHAITIVEEFETVKSLDAPEDSESPQCGCGWLFPKIKIQAHDKATGNELNPENTHLHLVLICPNCHVAVVPGDTNAPHIN